MSFELSAIDRDLRLFTSRGLLTDAEAAQVREVVRDDFPFAEAMNSAESLHVHVSADEQAGLPSSEEIAAACREATGDDRERKFVFTSGLNVIFALDATAQDEFVEGAPPRAKPYVDHLGVDLRDEADETKLIFDSIPTAAGRAGWRHVAQEGPVRCCHVEMGPKHWVYPPEGVAGTRRPIEFAFGELKMSDEYLGCDYRPIDPAHPLASMVTMAGSPVNASAATRPAVTPSKIYVFEECSCNVSPSTGLLDLLRERFPNADIRAFDMAKPEGLLPLPPALFLALEEHGSASLPALVVDGQVRTEGWLPEPSLAVMVVEHPETLSSATSKPAAASCCAPDSSTCC
jgi:hypothetical protein